MRKAKIMILGALLTTACTLSAAPIAESTETNAGIEKYALKSFNAEFTHFNLGDNVPELYRTEEYNIKQWQLRHLPAPDEGSHWTYMDGSYVLITDAEGKIIKIYDGEIFYHR